MHSFDLLHYFCNFTFEKLNVSMLNKGINFF